MTVNTKINTIYQDDILSDTIDLSGIDSSKSIVYTTMGVGAIGSNINGTINTTTGTGTSYNWNTTSVPGTWSNISITSNPNSLSSSGVMELQGENADVKINGRSLMNAIENLEQRLNILVPNPELEAEWDELKELGDRYRELEKKCKEKGEMWNKLKTMPPPKVE